MCWAMMARSLLSGSFSVAVFAVTSSSPTDWGFFVLSA